MNVAEARAADASVAAARKWLLRKRLSQGGFLFGIRWREGSRRRGAIADEKRADEGLSSDQELRRGSRIKGTRRRHQARVRKQVLYVTAGGGKCRNFKFPAAPLARRQPQSAEALSGRLRPMGVVPCRVQTPNTARRRPARRSQKNARTKRFVQRRHRPVRLDPGTRGPSGLTPFRPSQDPRALASAQTS